ncbi:MAG TPA: hypothetical protein VET25_09625 [Aestuariivirgaceae bacterium]|nr:hypothetical protein [Aestuariivirgaceae bacterium]
MVRFTLPILIAFGLVLAGCGVRVGGGIGGNGSDDVIYYPPGPEIRKAQENAQRTADEP